MWRRPKKLGIGGIGGRLGWPRGLPGGEEALKSNMEGGAVQVSAEPSGRSLGAAAVWAEAVTHVCQLLAEFSRKDRLGIDELALEQPNGLAQVIADPWFIFLTFKVNQMTSTPLL